jgi:hypothetical protein
MNDQNTTPDPTPRWRAHGTRLLAASVVAGMAALTLGAGSAHAQESTPADDARPRVERACARIPNLQTRVDNAIARINGDADTRGSLAWLDGRIQRANDNGRADLATALTNRRAVRVAALDVLELRSANLVELAALCASKGF